MHDSHHHEPVSPELAARAAEAQAALEALLRQAMADYADDHSQPPDHALTLAWTAGMSADHLLDQVVQGVHLHHGPRGTFVSGHVYCHACQSPVCEHGLPPEPGQVFAGYANNGTPLWRELFNQLLELGDDRVDQLFESKPRLLSRLVGRRHLIADQMLAFGRNSMAYRIIGQAILGYLAIRGARCAVTVQIVETADRQVRLQTIAPDVLREALADAPSSGSSLYRRVNDALAKARRGVEGIQGTWHATTSRQDRHRLENDLVTLLRRLVSSVEQKDRQARRRTRHAEDRLEDQRPIYKAGDDVARAKVEDFYEDTVRKSKIVVGRGSRCHVFNDDGQHVTSLLLTADKVERRKRTNRYVALSPEDVKAFRPLILSKIHEGGDLES